MRAVVVLGSALLGYSSDEGNIEQYILLGIVVAQTIALILPDKLERTKKNASPSDESSADSKE